MRWKFYLNRTKAFSYGGAALVFAGVLLGSIAPAMASPRPVLVFAGVGPYDPWTGYSHERAWHRRWESPEHAYWEHHAYYHRLNSYHSFGYDEHMRRAAYYAHLAHLRRLAWHEHVAHERRLAWYLHEDHERHLAYYAHLRREQRLAYYEHVAHERRLAYYHRRAWEY